MVAARLHASLRAPADTSWLVGIALAGFAGAGAFALSAYFVNPFAFPLVVLGFAFASLAVWRPAWGVAGALLAAPLELVSLPLPSGALSPSEAAFAVVALGWLWRALVRPGEVRLPSLRDAPIILLLFTYATGLVIADDAATVLRVTFLWLLFAFVFLQVQSFGYAEMRLVIIAFAISVGILGSIGAFKYLTSGDQQLFAGGRLTGDRASGTFTDPNYYASLLALGVLPGVALVLADLRRYAWLLIPLAGAIAGVVFSLSRGGIAGLAAGVAVLLVWRRARLVILALALALAAMAVADIKPPGADRPLRTVEQRLGTLNSSLEGTDRRPDIWGTAFHTTEAHPFFGVGVKQFKVAATAAGLTERGDPLENVHNIPLNFAAENGLIGLAAFLLICAQFLWRGIRGMRSAGSALHYAIALGLLAAFAGFFLQGLSQSQLRVNIIAATFFVFGGMASALADRVTTPESRSTP